MMDGIKEESVGALFNLKVEVQQNPITEEAGETGVAAPATAPELGVAPAAGPAPGSAPEVPSAPATETSGAGTAAPGAGPAAPGTAPRTGGNGASGRSGAGAPRAANKTTTGTRATASKTAAGAKTPAGTGRAAGTGKTAAGTGKAAGADRTTAGTGGRHRGGPKNAEAEGNGNGAAPVLPAGLGPRRSGALQYTAPSVDGGTHVESHVEGTTTGGFTNVGRNDPCPCGSGRKYKRCHGDPRKRVAD